jgi:regulatory protein
MSFAKPSLKGRALRLLSGREYSRTELERKLIRFEEEPGTLSLALDDLQVKGFISEARVIESVIHRRSGKLGLMRIRQELQGKGLDPEAVTTALSGLKDSERERAQEVWRKKFGALAADAQDAAKQMRFLASRGFGGDVIRQVVKGASDD